MHRLLMIAPFFPPSAVIGAHRPTKLIRRIRAFGWEPHVLTLAEGCQHDVDRSYGTDVLASTPITRLPCRSPWHHAAQPLPRAFLSKVINRLTRRWLPVGDGLEPWIGRATAAGVRLVQDQKIDLIWATTPVSSIVAGSRVSRRTGVPFVADYRDIFRPCPAEARALQGVAGITCAAPRFAEELARRYPFLAGRPQCVVHNWFEKEDAAIIGPPLQFPNPTILHGGLLGETSQPASLLEAVATLRQRPEWHHLQFLQLGTELARFQPLIARLNLADAVVEKDRLGRPAFLAAAGGASILLLVVRHDLRANPHGYSAAVPAKLYDYFLAQRPILVIGPRDCYAGQLVTQCGRGLAADDHSPGEIAAAIERLLAGQGAAGPLNLSLDAVRDYEASAAVRKMSEFLDSLVPDSTG